MPRFLPTLLACITACAPSERPRGGAAPPRSVAGVHRDDAGSAEKTAPIVAVEEARPPRILTVGGARPATVLVPASQRDDTPSPLVVMLHAYGVSGALEEWFFGLKPFAHGRGFLYVAPDGTPAGNGKLFWSATDACCAWPLPTPKVDDVAYLRSVIEDVARLAAVDRKRVYLVGHSNGGFMAHRLACEHPELVAAIVSVAGATFADPKACKATSPVSILQIHGTKDTTVQYDGGGYFGHAYPSARTTAETWARVNGCGAPTSGASLDLDSELAGLETDVLRWTSGCAPGGHVELWTIRGGSHVPTPTPAFTAGIVDYLFAHPKP